MLKEIAEKHYRFFKEHFRDDAGLLFSVLAQQTLKPFIAPQMEGFIFEKSVGDVAGCFNYEDTLMTIGSYIKSLASRISTCGSLDAGNGTRGSDVFMAEAEECLAAIERLQAEHTVRGLLTKPYSGKPSSEVSIDQYAELVFGLYELAKMAPQKIRCRIVRLMAAWADFWMEIDYRRDYFGKPAFWACQPHAAVCLAMMLITAEVTGEDKYRKEAERLCLLYNADAAPLRVSPTWTPPRDNYRMRSAAYFQHLVAESLYYLPDLLPQRREEWLFKLYQWWKYEINLGVDTDGLTYFCFRVHLPTNAWQPVGPEEIDCSQPFDKTSSFRYVHRCKSGAASAHIAATAVRVGRHLEACRPECRDMARFILESLDRPEKMLFYIDPDGNQLRQHEKQLGYMIQGKSYTQWLCAYWQGKTLGWWD